MNWRVTMKRLLKGCGTTLLVVLIGAGALTIWQWQSAVAWWNLLSSIAAAPQYLQGLDTREEVLGYVQERRDDVALVSFSVGADGQPLNDGTAISHNADTPMPLASTMKIVLLAAYAQQVEAGGLNPDERVPVREWERYYLPGTDGGAHARMLRELGLAADAQGFATDPNASVSLDQLVRAMIRYSDNAATDYLLLRLGPQAVQQAITAGGLQAHEPILPVLGTFLSWQNHQQPGQQLAHIDTLRALPPAEYAAEVERLTAAYQDEAWRTAELRWRDHRAVTNIVFEEAAGRHLMPKGTANDYARMMAGVVTGTFISPQVSATMRRHLEWPLEQAVQREHFDSFGTKGGSVAGVLTTASFYIPKTRDFAGQPRVVVLFMHEVPFTAWTRLQQTNGILGFTNALVGRREFVSQVQATLEAGEEVTHHGR
jgi:hypothetical protein